MALYVSPIRICNACPGESAHEIVAILTRVLDSSFETGGKNIAFVGGAVILRAVVGYNTFSNLKANTLSSSFLGSLRSACISIGRRYMRNAEAN